MRAQAVSERGRWQVGRGAGAGRRARSWERGSGRTLAGGPDECGVRGGRAGVDLVTRRCERAVGEVGVGRGEAWVGLV